MVAMRNFDQDDIAAFSGFDYNPEKAMISEDVITVEILDVAYVGRVIQHGFTITLHLETGCGVKPPSELYRHLTIESETLTVNSARWLCEAMPEKPTVSWLFTKEFKIV